MLAVLLTLLLLCFSQVPPVLGVAQSSTSSTTTSAAGANVAGNVTIDQAQFKASVPQYALLGENYSLRIIINSNANLTVPIIIEVSVPVGAIYVHPRVVRTSIQPGGLVVANFSILPFGTPHGGPYNVTALLYVFFPLSMSSPLLVDQATGTVSSIGYNPFPYLPLVLASAAAASLALILVFYKEIFRKDVTGSI